MVISDNHEGRTAPVQAIYSNERSTGEQNVRVNFNEQLTNGTNNYEPFNYGNEQYSLGFIDAFLHLSRYIIGSGLLILPYCFFKVGYLIGIVGVTVICLLYLHIVHIFLSIEYELCKRFQLPNLTYLGVVQKSFDVGPVYVRKLKSTFSFLICFIYVLNGTLCNAAYLCIMSFNLKKFVDFHTQTNYISVTYCLTCFIIPLNTITVFIGLRKIKFFLTSSIFFNLFTLFSIIIIILGFNAMDDGQQLESVNDLFYVPQFCGIVLGAITCTRLSLPVKNDMEKPKKFRLVLNISIIISTVIYISFAIRAYFIYGQFTQGNILLNLPMECMSSTVVLNLYSMKLVSLFYMNIQLNFDITWTNYLADKLKENICAFTIASFFRLSLNLGAYFLALLIPNCEMILSLSGSFCIFTEICLPPIMQILVSWSDNKFVTVTTLKNVAIVLIAFGFFVFTFVNSVIDIVALY